MDLTSLGEFGLIRRIRRRVGPGCGVVRGIGDDCAVTLPAPGSAILSTVDLLTEGVHFDRSFHPPRLLGRKSLSVNVSDVAACGGTPRHALLALAIPPGTDTRWVDGFMDGFLAVAREEGVTLTGGDTCGSKGGVTISVTLMGEREPAGVVGRHGAREGDLIVVSGTLGDSATGLELLRQGERDLSHPCIRRHLDPTPRSRLGRLLADRGLATAMIDVSDGLLADLEHILEESGGGAVVQVEAIPLSDPVRRVSSDPLDAALSGGEDYELLFTIPSGRKGKLEGVSRESGIPLTVIGRVTGGQGITLREGDRPLTMAPSRGYDHFRSG